MDIVGRVRACLARLGFVTLWTESRKPVDTGPIVDGARNGLHNEQITARVGLSMSYGSREPSPSAEPVHLGCKPWWRHMEKLSALLVLCDGNPQVIREFPSQRVSNTELWCFLCCYPKAVELTVLGADNFRCHDAHVTQRFFRIQLTNFPVRRVCATITKRGHSEWNLSSKVILFSAPNATKPETIELSVEP